MIAQFKDWYGIEEIAEMFECKVDDINHFIKSGKLNTVLWFDDEPAILDYGDGKEYETRIRGLWSTLKPLRYGLIAGDKPVVYSLNHEDPEKSFSDAFERIVSSIEEAFALKKDGFSHIIAGVFQDKFIVTDRVFRFYGDSKTAKRVVLKKELDDFKSIVTLNHSNRVSEILNNDHPWYSSELAIAVNAWFALYADQEGNKGDNAFKPNGGHPEMIKKWLKDNFEKSTTPTSRERIASVVSPSSITGPGTCPPWNSKKNTPKI
jgi:hypothetical protein